MHLAFDFDLGGQLRLIFDETAVEWVDHSLSATVRGELKKRRIAKNERVPYEAVEWVGQIRIRQLGMALLGCPCTLLGLVWTVAYIGDWGPWAFSVVFLFLLGIWPLSLFFRGRRFLGIASAIQIIVIPLDRKKRQIRKILQVLDQVCPPPRVRWELGSTPFADRQSWALESL
jgi:hypothetical protein